MDYLLINGIYANMSAPEEGVCIKTTRSIRWNTFSWMTDLPDTFKDEVTVTIAQLPFKILTAIGSIGTEYKVGPMDLFYKKYPHIAKTITNQLLLFDPRINELFGHELSILIDGKYYFKNL